MARVGSDSDPSPVRLGGRGKGDSLPGVASVVGIDLEMDNASVVAGAVFLLTADYVRSAARTAEPGCRGGTVIASG